MRKIIIGILTLIILIGSAYTYLVYKNNIDVPPPSKQDIQLALDKSINWVLDNQDELIKINNPVLWWFLDQSAYLINNRELSNLVRKYRNTVLEKHSVWNGYWVKKPSFSYLPGSLDHMANYLKFFVYGLTCDTDLGEEKTIQDQLDINFCDWRPYYSSCITHQLMGVRLLQTKSCGDSNLYQNLTVMLAEKIEDQLTWDPRVGDVFIQRVLMLVESGNIDKVKSVWVHCILNEQLKNGSWATFDKILPLYDDKYFGFSYKFIDIKTPTSSFHSTAQAIYLLSLISQQYR